MRSCFFSFDIRYFSKQREPSFIRDQYCHLADDDSLLDNHNSSDFSSPTHKDLNHYNHCDFNYFRREKGFCRMCYYTAAAKDFQISGKSYNKELSLRAEQKNLTWTLLETLDKRVQEKIKMIFWTFWLIYRTIFFWLVPFADTIRKKNLNTSWSKKMSKIFLIYFYIFAN